MKKLMLTIDYNEHLATEILVEKIGNIVGVHKVTPIVEATAK